MRASKLSPRLMAHACAALLVLTTLAPLGDAAPQRRRPSSRPRPAATPAPRPAASPAPRAGATPAPAPSATPGAPQQARRLEPNPSFEELLSADAYTVYAEVRRVGTLSRAAEIKSAVAA